ncbi:MAG TPA: hypothetical protein VGR57_04220, partial [Ktedonobacterales bacterium]|nr:hypothetical protein [Ktedonobacterales bacterium]
MTGHANRFTRFGRSRWLLTAISAVVAIVTIAAISLRLVPASANSGVYQAPAFAAKFANESDADAGRLDLSFEQAYDSRAYPATEIPLQATLDAQTAFNSTVSRGQGNHANGAWSQIGSTDAKFPGVLTFSGADYTTSGRITALAIDSTCNASSCRLWVAAAGGGVWRTDHALSGNPVWTFVSGGFATNAIGTLTFANGVLYAGTGEPNASGDSEAGLGIYKSSDGGDTWTHLSSTTTVGIYTGDAFANRSISTIVVDPSNANTLWVSDTRGVRGVSSVTGGAISTPPAPRPPFGLYKSTDGGASFTFVWDGAGTARGVNHVALDPSDNTTVYAAAYGEGVFRSLGGGAFTNIKLPLSTINTDRTEFAVAKLASGKTRMYVGDGAQGSPTARFYRTDDATAAAPVFTNLTTLQNRNYCTGQCWYDNSVVSPAGFPDSV